MITNIEENCAFGRYTEKRKIAMQEKLFYVSKQLFHVFLLHCWLQIALRIFLFGHIDVMWVLQRFALMSFFKWYQTCGHTTHTEKICALNGKTDVESWIVFQFSKCHYCGCPLKAKWGATFAVLLRKKCLCHVYRCHFDSLKLSKIIGLTKIRNFFLF